MKSDNRIFSYCIAGRTVAVLALLLTSVVLSMGEPENQVDKLASVFRQMEKSSKNFKCFAADISKKKYTKILEEFDRPEIGKFYYKRSGNGSALIREEITDPAERITTIDDQYALIYQPKIKSANRAKLGEHKDKVEYLVMGIGQSPTELKKKFDISYLGSETINDAVCSVLNLKPKDPAVTKYVSSIIIWVKDLTGVSTQVKLEYPYEDYLLVNFSNEKLDNEMDDSLFKQKLSKDVEIQNY